MGQNRIAKLNQKPLRINTQVLTGLGYRDKNDLPIYHYEKGDYRELGAFGSPELLFLNLRHNKEKLEPYNVALDTFMKDCGFDNRTDHTVREEVRLSKNGKWIKYSSEYRTVKAKVSKGVRNKHFLGGESVSMDLMGFLLCVEFDTHDWTGDKTSETSFQDITIARILKRLKVDSAYIWVERNENRKGGVHIYIWSDKWISNEDRKEIEKILRKDIYFNIEVKNRMKLPLSPYYRKYAGRFNGKKIVSEKKYIDKIYSLNECKENRIKIGILDELSDVVEVAPKASMWKDAEVKEVMFEIFLGESYKKIPLVMWYCIAKGLSFEQCKQMILDADRGCRRLQDKNWINSKDCANWWDLCKKTYKGQQVQSGESAEYLNTTPVCLPRNRKELRMCDKNTWEMLKNLMKLDANAKVVLQAILSKAKYLMQKNAHYVEEELQFLNGGVPFGQDLLKMLAESEHCNFALLHRAKCAMEKSGILKTKTNEEGFNYSYKKRRYVKHYYLEGMEELLDSLARIIIPLVLCGNDLLEKMENDVLSVLFSPEVDAFFDSGG